MTRVAFVTGGTRGIGRAICERLIADGHKVAAGYSGNEEAAAACAKALGVMVVPTAPFQFSETPPEIQSKPPRFGQHTAEVLKGLGYSDADIARVRADGVV